MLAHLTAAELAERIRRRDATSVEAVSSCIEQIEALDPAIKAWVTVDRAGALQAAAERDAEAGRGGFRGPLHGVPVGIKDIIHVAGLVTTAGARPFAHTRPTEDATVVARLRAAGAVILGKTATTEFAHSEPAETRNPWNLAHTPGGSSSGSAASVAARMVPLAFGTQTMGSILRPAAYCGIVGLKATHGRVSCRGVIPDAWSLDHVGILCRTVTDAALTLQVIAGYDPADPRSLALPADDYASARLDTPPRLAAARHPEFIEVAPEVAANLRGAAEAFSRSGASVEDVDLPRAFSGLRSSGLTVMLAESAAYHRDQFSEHRDEYRPRTRALVDAGLQISATEYLDAVRHLQAFRSAMDDLLAGRDALLLPVAPSPAPEGLGSTGDPYFCAPWSCAGVPAVSLPSGLSGDLPLAVQLVGRWNEEARLLGVARWCEVILDFSAAPPGVSH